MCSLYRTVYVLFLRINVPNLYLVESGNRSLRAIGVSSKNEM